MGDAFLFKHAHMASLIASNVFVSVIIFLQLRNEVALAGVAQWIERGLRTKGSPV